MHLGFLTSEYPHPRTTPAAGIGSSIKNMVAALVEKGIKISLFIYGQKEDAVFTEAGIKFHLIRQRKFRMFGWYLHRKTIQNYLNKYIELDNIDAIEAPDWTGITAFMKLRCPLVIRINGSDAYFCKLEKRPQKKKNFWFEKTALEGADHLLSVSRFTAEETQKIFNLKKNIKVIPNSVYVNRFKPISAVNKEKTLLYFGSIIRKKGVLELAEIFNIISQQEPSIKLCVAGKDVWDKTSGTSTWELFENILSPEAKKNMVWLGELSYEKVLDQIAAANVIALPSFAEALPMTWIEAMAMEKALVTSDIGWAKEVMKDGVTGFTIDPEDHQLYAEKILQLINNPVLAEQMGNAARQRVLEKFSAEMVAEQNIRYYDKVLKKKK